MKQRFLLKTMLLLCALIAGSTSVWGQTTYKLTIDASDFNTSSYADNNNEKTSNAVCTTDNTKTYEVKWTSNQVMKSGNNMQWQKSKGYIYNSTDLGTITNVTVTSSAGTFTTYYGTEAQPSSNTTVGGGFFKTCVGSSATGTTSKIEITFTISDAAVTTTTTINATGITNTDVYTSTVAGSLSASVVYGDNKDVEGASVTWSGNNDDVATIDASTGVVTLVAAGKVTFTASYAGVAGQYLASYDTYEMTVTSSAPYVQPTEIEIVPNYEFWGQTAQFSGDTYSELSGSQDNVTLEWSRGNGSMYASTTAMRFYKDNALTFTAPTGYVILSIGLTMSQAQSDLTFDPAGYSTQNTTWTGSSETVTMSRPSNASSYAQITKITVTIGEFSSNPSIIASDVDIAYDATSGSFNFTVNNPVSGGETTVSENVDWISNAAVSGNSVTFTTTANENTTAREGVITLTYTYGNESVTKEVTITQAAAPLIYTTIPALFNAATGTETNVLVTFNDWVVSGVSTNGKNVFVTDNNGNGFVIFDNNGGLNNTYAAGNILSGTAISCSLKKYNGFAELLNVTATDLTITTGGTVTVANVAMADLAGINTGALVRYQNLTCSVTDSKYYLSDGTTSIQVYNSLYAFDALEDGKVYNITGVYQQYNSTKEILPRSAADIVKVAVPSITLSTNTINAVAAGGSGTITVTYENFTVAVSEVRFCDVTGGTATYDWITASINASNNIEYTVSANTGAERTAYMKVYALDAQANELYSELITVTQAKFVADKFVKVTSDEDLTDGEYLIVYEDGGVAFDGSLDELDVTGNTIPVTISNGEIEANATTCAAVFIYNSNSLQSASGVYIGRTTDENGMNQSAETAYPNAISIDAYGDADILASGGAYLRYNSASNQNRFRYYKSTGYTGQRAIQLYKHVVPVTVAATKQYVTFCSPFNLNFTVDGLDAYVVSEVTSTSAKITSVSYNIPAGTGLILKRTGDLAEAATFNVPVAIDTDDMGTNYLVGVTADKNMDNEANAYILSDGLFYKCSGGTLAAGKAYLSDKEGVWASSGAPSFSIVIDGETTGIRPIDNGQLIMDNVIYDLSGRRVENPTKGIYIMNGKKVVIK